MSLNPLRWRAIMQSRRYKRLLMKDGALSGDAEAMLADLRDFCFADKTTFAGDALMIARREGRREVFLRMQGFLGLDEGQVQKLMENDDGL